MKYKSILSVFITLIIASMTLFSIGCQTSEGTSQLEGQETRQIAHKGASALLDIGFAAIIANNPELATQMRLARQGISYLASADEEASVDVNTLTADLQAAILEQVDDPVIADVLVSDFADGLAAADPPENVPASSTAYSDSDRAALLAALRKS